jgi:hypothetical protein
LSVYFDTRSLRRIELQSKTFNLTGWLSSNRIVGWKPKNIEKPSVKIMKAKNNKNHQVSMFSRTSSIQNKIE